MWDNTFICNSTKKLSCFLEHTNLIYILWYVEWKCLDLRVSYEDFVFNQGPNILWWQYSFLANPSFISR